jgi:hypothetical protein
MQNTWSAGRISGTAIAGFVHGANMLLMSPLDRELAMNAAYFPAFAALAGSAIGALGGVVTTWITLNGQQRARRFAREMSRKEQLYAEFIEESSKLYTAALTHKLDDLSKLIPLYAQISKLRLFASDNVIAKAEEVMWRVIQTYERPEEDVHTLVKRGQRDLDLLRPFSEACRRDLDL